MLRSSEWVLLGIMFAAIFELVAKEYGFSWKYLSYAFSICAVIAFRVFLWMLSILTRWANHLLSEINDM